MARKPQVPKTLQTFTGCDIGEPRIGCLIKTSGFDEHEEMASKGYLQQVKAPPTKPKENYRIWYALTPQGKKVVAKLENYYAQRF